MKKTTLFISAALTTFMLAVMFGVAYAYQKVVQVGGATNVAAQSQSIDAMPTAASVKAGMTIEKAADLASNVIGNSEVYSAEVTQLNGVDSYLVTFSSGDLVYVSLDGKILSISKLPPTVILAPPSGGSGNHSGGDDSHFSNPGNSAGNVNINSNGNSNFNDNENDDDHGSGNENESGDD